MAKKKWFQAAGLVLLCHLTLTACQSKQEAHKTPSPSKTVQSSKSAQTTKPQKDESRSDKKKEGSASKRATDKGKEIPGVTVPTSDGFILTDHSKILTHTKDGIVVDHDGHSHFIFYTDLKDTKFAHLIPTKADLTKSTSAPQSSQQPTSNQQAAAGDHHYTFNPADIVAEDALGYTVRHDDHYHYILKSSLASQPVHSGGNGGATNQAQSNPVASQTENSKTQGIAGIDYPTSDGFIFDGSGIQGWTDLGLMVNHDGHLHLILKADLAQSKWAYLLASQPSQPVVIAQPSQPSLPSQPTVSVTPAQPSQPTAPTTAVTPAGDDVALKRAYLAAATGLLEKQIVLLDTPNGPAFMYPHGDHSHLVLLSSLDVTKPFDDGHGSHDHGDDHAHNEGEGHDGHAETTVPETPTVSEPTTPTQPAQPSEPETPERPAQPTTPAQPEVPAAPTKPVQPETPEVPTAPQSDVVAVKRAYLAQATGLTEDKIVLLDTPNGPAFMYPHGDHSHLVLLSSLDVTKPFDDGHGGHDYNDGDEHGHEETTVPDAPTVSEPSNPTQPAQPSEAETPEVPAQPITPVQPEVPSEPTQPVQPETPEVPTSAEEVSTTVEPPAAADGEAPTVSETTEHTGEVNPDVSSDSNETQPADSEETAVVSPVTQPEVPTIPAAPVTGNQETTPELPVTEPPVAVEVPAQPTEPAIPEQPEAPTEPVVSTPPAAPQIDEVALKRAYLAAATGLLEEQILLLNTPAGPSFMYPHGDHHHVILISQLDVTKPFDDGHGNHGTDDGSDQGHPGDNDHAHDDNSQDDGHRHDINSGQQQGDNPADADNQGKQTDTGDTHKHDDHADDANSGEQASDGQTDTGNQGEQDGDMTSGQDDTNHQDQPGASTPDGTDQAVGGSLDTVGQPVDDQPSDSTQPTPPKTGFPGIDYATSDGFLFDGTGVAGWTSAGLLVDHNGHLHILTTEAIAQSKWAHLLPSDKPGTATAPVELSEKLAKQREDLAKQLGLKTEDIRVITADGKVVAFEYPHEDHTHLVPVTDDETPKTGLTDEEKRELTAYIRKTYGLLLGTPVTFHENFVVFAIPHPHQDYDANRDYYSDVLDPAYDPGHVHPYAVPLSTLSIPKTTDIPELDFENELILAAKRIGVAPSEVKIKDKKYFVLPGKDHDHYLNILTPVSGLDAYMANKLPNIKANFVVGDYSKDTVLAEADRILAAAKDKFGDGTVEFRRVARALEAFKANLTVATTSTEGYVKALQSFENKHLKGLTEDTAEVTEVTDPVVATYLSLTDRLKGYDERTLKNFGLDAEQKVAELKRLVAAKDEAGLARVVTHFNAIDRVKRAANDLGPRLAYMDFFVRNVDSDKLPASLRQEVLDKLMELQKISGLYRNPQKFMAGLESTALLKERVKVALAAEGPAPDHANWTPYPRGYDRREIVREVNSMRDFVIKHKEVTAEELAEGFNKPLELFKDLPKKPTQPATPPKPVEEAPKPTEPTQPTTGTTDPAPTQPKTPEQPAETPEVSLEEQHAGIKTWLDGLAASLLRRYTIDRDTWSGDLETALTNDDAADMAKFQAYMDAIVRVEKQNNINASRTAHVDYFLRHIDQAYLDNSLREQVAEQLVKIYAATTYDYKKVLVETVALKAAIKAAIDANQTHDVMHGDAYHAFLEKKEDMVTSVELRKAFLINQGSLTKEELAEGFGQPYPVP